LTVEIVDIDRAGSFEARTPALSAVRYGEDPLRYEKALLDDWLERELSAARRSDR
jgi:hypothetical protein